MIGILFLSVGSFKKKGRHRVFGVTGFCIIQLMEEILHQFIGSLSHCLQGFLHPNGGWPWDFWTINKNGTPLPKRWFFQVGQKKNWQLLRETPPKKTTMNFLQGLVDATPWNITNENKWWILRWFFCLSSFEETPNKGNVMYLKTHPTKKGRHQGKLL